MPAQATHFRYGNLNWQPTSNPGEVKFSLTAAFRRTAYGNPNVGDIFTESTGATRLFFGDGTRTGTLQFRVTALSATDDYVIGEALHPGTTTPGVLHTYEGAGPYTEVGVSACCRISTALNRRDEDYNLLTTVTPLSGNASPVSSQIPIVSVTQGTASTFTVSANDPNGDGLRYRFATNSEAGGGSAPPGMTINPNSGVVTWNTVGLNTNGYWTTQVIIEDLDLEGEVKTSSPVDFLLKINVPSGNAPTLAINPAGPINVAPFTPISFSVAGADIDGGAVVTLNTGGLPNGASMTPVLPISGAGSPGVSSTFAWTPQPANSGSYVITYSVTDDTGAQAQASISINVSTLPEPTVTASPVTNITFNSATLNGIVNPNGVATTYRFEYGVNATYGNSTAPLSAGSGESGIAVTGALTGLSLSTEYHYRLVGSSAGGTTATSDATFITAGPPNIPPTITLTAPANPTTITEIDPLIVTATATDQDGVIAKVEFFQGITKLGEDTTAPYEFDAGVFPVGTYLITTVATDDDGDSTVSGVATLNVIEAIPVAVDDHAFSSLTTTRINPRRNDTGPASLPLTIVAVGGAPTKGTASVIEGGLRVMYTSNAPLATNEFDSFTYTVRNSIGRESTATIFVHPAPLKGAQFAAHMKDHHGEVFGFVTYKFVRNGTFSGILTYDGKRYGILGTLTGDSPLVLNIKRGQTVLPLPLEVSAGPIVDGSVTLSTEVLDPFGDEYWSGNAVYSPYSSANQSVRAGYYTVGFDSDPAYLGDTNYPQGGAGLSVRVVSDGSVRIVGRSPDGVGISFYGNLISGDRIPFYLATGPSARRGKWHGEMQFTTSGPELTADSEWTMPARDGTLLYPGGFTVAMPGVGCAYTRPTALEILGGPNVAFEFSNGGFLSPVTANLIIGTTPLIAGPAPLTTTRVNRVYGYISGQVRNVQAGGVQGFFGVALQHPALNRFQGSTYRKTSIGNFEGVVVP